MTIIDDESLPSKELLEAVLGYPKMVETNVPYIINIIGKPYLFTDNTENIWFNTDNVGLVLSLRYTSKELEDELHDWKGASQENR